MLDGSESMHKMLQYPVKRYGNTCEKVCQMLSKFQLSLDLTILIHPCPCTTWSTGIQLLLSIPTAGASSHRHRHERFQQNVVLNILTVCEVNLTSKCIESSATFC